MPEQKKPIREGYQPSKKGDHPEPATTPSKPSPKGGYQPTTSEGDNPANEPTPPKEE